MVFVAVTAVRLRFSGAPVFGFTSKRGKWLIERSTRSRGCILTLVDERQKAAAKSGLVPLAAA